MRVSLLLLCVGLCFAFELPPLPNSCKKDAQCAGLSICNDDGMCVEPGPGTLPVHHLMSVPLALTLAACLGCFSLCVSLTVGFAVVRVRQQPDADANTSDFAAGVFAVACAACCAVAVISGCTLSMTTLPESLVTTHGKGRACSFVDDIACEPYFCDVGEKKCFETCQSSSTCSSGTICVAGQCVAEDPTLGLERPLLSAPLAWTLAAFSCVFCCLFCFTHGVRVCPSPQLLCCSVVIGALCGGALYYPLSSHIAIEGRQDGDGAPCEGFRACAPYFCDMNNHQCVTKCSTNYQCQPGFMCHSKSGKCVVRGSGITGPPSNLLAIGVVAVTCGLFACLLCVCCTSVCVAIVNDERPAALFRALPFVCCGGLLLLAVVAGVIAAPFFLMEVPLDIVVAGKDNNQSHCVDTGASICEPFLCDRTRGRCYGECSTDLMCAPNAHCVNKNCVGIEAITTPLAPGWAVFEGILILATLAAVVGGLCVRYRFPGPLVAMDVVAAALCLFLTALFILTVTLALPLVLLGHEVKVGKGTGAPCRAGAVSSSCFPYFCDVKTHRCMETCSNNAQCRDGRTCLQGTCVVLPEDALFPSNTTYLITIVAAVLSSVAASYALYNTLQSRQERALVERRRPVVQLLIAECGGVWVGLLVAVLVLVPLSYRSVAVFPPQDEGTHSPVTCHFLEAIVCQPFTCDTLSHTCLKECQSSAECASGWQCRSGRCEEQSFVWTFVLDAAVMVVLIMFLVCLAATQAYTEYMNARRVATHRAAAREEVAALRRNVDERRKALETHKSSHMVPSFLLDIIPRAVTDASMFEESSLEDRGVTVPLLTGIPSSNAECCICYAATSSVRLSGGTCQHGYCDECARDALHGIVDHNRFPARCPGCTADTLGSRTRRTDSSIPADVVEQLVHREVLSEEFARRFLALQIMKSFNPREVLSCPNCELVSFKPAPEQTQKGHTRRDVEKEKLCVQCPGCDTEFCGTCTVLWFVHEDMTCEDVARATRDEDTQRTILGSSKECPTCGVSITHHKGHACHHIAPGTGCPSCGTHFCIVCLEKYPCALTTHGLFCDDRCDCPPCPDCTEGHPCPLCPGTEMCPSCHPPAPVRPSTPANMPRLFLGNALEEGDAEESLRAFIDITGENEVAARNYLLLFGYDQEAAVRYYYETQ